MTFGLTSQTLSLSPLRNGANSYLAAIKERMDVNASHRPWHASHTHYLLFLIMTYFTHPHPCSFENKESFRVREQKQGSMFFCYSDFLLPGFFLEKGSKNF